MKKIVLINPPSPWLNSDTDIPPLGLLYIASFLQKQNFNVEFLDLSGGKQYNIPYADIYGITGCVAHDQIIRDISSRIKETYPKSIIVLGGAHASTLPIYILHTMPIDIIVLREGEITFTEIVSGKPINDIKGIVYRNKNKIIFTGNRDFIKDIDTLPPPNWDLLDTSKYSATVTHKDIKIRGASIITSRGCPSNCSFCASPYIYQRRVRFHSAEYIYEHAKYLINNYKYEGFYFLDDIFTLNHKRLIKICNYLKELNVPWRAYSRTDTINYEILKIMKQSGCVQIDYGVESGSQDILDKVNKKVKVQTNLNTIKLTEEMGITAKYCLIIGLPGENKDSIEQTKDFIKQLNSELCINTFVPVPGSDIWRFSDKYNYKIDRNIPFCKYFNISKDGKGTVIELNKEKEILEYIEQIQNLAGNKNIYLKVKEKMSLL